MTIAFAVLFVFLGVAAGDVAHLERSYLPPARTVALPFSQSSFSGSRTSSFTAGNGYSNRLTQAAPAANYIAPAANYIAPAANYIAPAANYIAPAANYIAPGPASFTSTNFASSISSPARFTAPAPQNFVSSVPQRLVALPAQSFIVPTSQRFTAPAAQNFIAPVSQNYAAPAPAPTAAFPAQKFSGAQVALPSRQYLSPEIETFEPLVVKQSYTAPAITYNAPASSAASSDFTAGSSAIETQYSSDGGYVY